MSLITPDSGLLFWMTLIFVIVFFVLAKFGFPLITGMVDKRAERINGSIAKAREAEEKLASVAREQARLVEEARIEQGRILKEASETRDRIVAQAKEHAAEEAAKIVEHARIEIATERETAISEIRNRVAMISVEVAEKIVRKELGDPAKQASLVDRMVEEASKARLN